MPCAFDASRMSFALDAFCFRCVFLRSLSPSRAKGQCALLSMHLASHAACFRSLLLPSLSKQSYRAVRGRKRSNQKLLRRRCKVAGWQFGTCSATRETLPVGLGCGQLVEGVARAAMCRVWQQLQNTRVQVVARYLGLGCSKGIWV